jgi:predicted extracellular nuclease
MYQGTRETKSFTTSHPSSREDNGFYTRDKGLSKRVIANATMGPTIFDAGANFSVFKVGDLVQVTGTSGGLNNGERTVLAVTASSLTVDFPCKSEGPTAGVEVRTQ